MPARDDFHVNISDFPTEMLPSETKNVIFSPSPHTPHLNLWPVTQIFIIFFSQINSKIILTVEIVQREMK